MDQLDFFAVYPLISCLPADIPPFFVHQYQILSVNCVLILYPSSLYHGNERKKKRKNVLLCDLLKVHVPALSLPKPFVAVALFFSGYLDKYRSGIIIITANAERYLARPTKVNISHTSTTQPRLSDDCQMIVAQN